MHSTIEDTNKEGYADTAGLTLDGKQKKGDDLLSQVLSKYHQRWRAYPSAGGSEWEEVRRYDGCAVFRAV